MQAEDLLKAGDLDGALAELQNAVRANPADPRLRIFLFQLLAVRGDWDRAIKQLKVSAEMDPLAVPMAQTYREGIICEVYREKVFKGEKEPLIFGEPQEWVAWLIEALKLLAEGQAEAAAELRMRAFDAASTASGTLNDQPFEWVADADTRLGPVLEAVVNGRYFWMPFTAIAEITVDPPEDLRDCVWMPVTLKLRTDAEIVALIPTRYAGTLEAGSDAAKLARSTDWVDLGSDSFAGIGQRLLTTDTGDVPLMELRSLKIDHPEAGAVADDG